MAKLYTNPVAAAEQGLAEFIAQVPAVSATLDPKGAGNVPVFAATDEGAAKGVRESLSLKLMQCVTVGFQRTEEVKHGIKGTPAKAFFNVTITSPKIIAEKAIRSTSDIGAAIIEALHGIQFAEPFYAGVPVLFESWTHYAGQQGEFIATLEFSAAIYMTPKF
jgi:hypothetical protein